jgi:hypothetical protein
MANRWIKVRQDGQSGSLNRYTIEDGPAAGATFTAYPSEWTQAAAHECELRFLAEMDSFETEETQ